MTNSMTRTARRAPGLGLGAGSVLAMAMALGWTPAQAADVAAAAAVEAGPVHIDPETADFGRQVDELVVTGASAALAAPTKASLAATEPQAIIQCLEQ